MYTSRLTITRLFNSLITVRDARARRKPREERLAAKAAPSPPRRARVVRLNHSERARRDNYPTITKTPTVELRIIVGSALSTSLMNFASILLSAAARLVGRRRSCNELVTRVHEVAKTTPRFLPPRLYGTPLRNSCVSSIQVRDSQGMRARNERRFGALILLFSSKAALMRPYQRN